MCHILFVLPFLAPPVFWLLPFPLAAPLYAATVALALVVGADGLRLRARRAN